ncbi:MAG: hypothetical protein JNK06_15860 [Candidatus Accumulibacter phosphatis]|uniref:hypothetical protein n=1 Tax=Candidatus Accumulibacter phosphatis TaxID=327160 RepID=UPI001A59D282|nr:hypothetical protein [Candidatus Accumulibacter phosphatis]
MNDEAGQLLSPEAMSRRRFLPAAWRSPNRHQRASGWRRLYGTPCGSLLLALLSLPVGCAPPTLRRDWSSYDGPGAVAVHRGNVTPPTFPYALKPVNRTLWGLSNALIAGVAKPLAAIHRALISSFARERIRGLAANLVFPRKVAANILHINRLISNELSGNVRP